MKNQKNQSQSIKSIKSISPAKPKRLSLQENNILTKTISIIFLILIICGLFAFIIYGLYKFKLIQTPAFIQNIFAKNTGSIAETKSDDANIYDILQNNTENRSENNSGYVLGITLENIKDIISKINVPDNLYTETSAVYYAGTISKQVKISLWKKDGKYKYTVTVNSKPEETYINDGKKEYIENYITGSKTTNNAGVLFSFANIPDVPDINYYLNLLDSGQITDCAVERGSDENTVSIRYEIPQLNQLEIINLSLDTGIVTGVKCYAGDGKNLYYKCETAVKEAYYDGDSQAAEKTAILDSVFAIK